MRNTLLKILSNLEAKIDFPDEDLPDDILNNIKNNFVESSEILEIKEVTEFLNSNSKRGITTFEND